MIIDVKVKTVKKPVVKINLNNLNEIIGIYDDPEKASKHAKRMYEKHGYKKELITCKWETIENIKNSLEKQIEIGLEYQKKFNSREGEQEIKMMRDFIKNH